jgi:hypothetical protein
MVAFCRPFCAISLHNQRLIETKSRRSNPAAFLFSGSFNA